MEKHHNSLNYKIPIEFYAGAIYYDLEKTKVKISLQWRANEKCF